MLDVIDTYDLSPMQQGMLFHAVSEKHSGVDIEQIVITLNERVDTEPFLHAWQEVIQRHTILRTRFRWEDMPGPRQEVVARAELPLTQVDWRELAPATCQRQFAAQLATDRRQDFDLTRAPLMRLFIAHVGADHQRIVWTFHHALLDGRSFPHVLREVFALYEAAQHGATVQLAAPSPYRDYIDWRRSLDFTEAEAHWRATLRGFYSPTPLGVDCIRPDDAKAEASSAFASAKQTRLSVQATAQLRATARAVGVTLNTMLQAAWALLLHRYSGESDIVFGATRAGRMTGLADNENRVGLFINTLPMRVNVDDALDVVSWLRAVRAQQTGLRAFEHTPLVAVQSWSEVPRGTPLFESLVVYEHSTLDSQLRSLGGAWQNRHFEYFGQTNYPLTVVAYGDEAMLLRLEYSRRRFSDAAIERMLGHLVTLLADLAHAKAAQLKDLTLLTASERAELVGTCGPARRYARGATLHERFEQQVARTPQAIALTGGSDEAREAISYAELNRRANVLAHQLRALGVGTDQLVGLRTERNAPVVIGILAILKAGGAYLPLDPVYPVERIAFMLQDAGVSIVLTQRSLQAELSGLAVTILCLDEPPSAAPEVHDNLPTLSGADDLAYVIYTSGSTGKPKGVRITHHNVARLFAATEAWYGFNERDVWTLFHSYAFDFSVWEMWGALLYGGRLVLVSLDTSRNTEAFRELLLREKVTVLNQTPTAFRQLIATELALPPAAFALRYVIFGGEALELQSLKPWFERYGEAAPRLINMYGITETTVHVTYRPITRADLTANAGSVIGEPLPDLRLYLLDPHGEPVPLGVPAELYVAGAGVAPGYLNRPELTAQRFLPDPFDPEPSARMYRSGDLVRRLDSGELEYLGRIDQQVKIRGFRIELGEIEAVIAQHPAVRQVAVIDRQDAPGEKRLAAYIVAHPPRLEILPALRERLRLTLPDYMTPAHFIFVQVLPLTHNGKLDRAALPAPADAIDNPRNELIAPRTASESLVVAAFAEVFNRRDIDVRDNFFHLGGHSLMAARVMARLRTAANIDLPLRNLFERPTPEGLAAAIDALAWTASAVSTSSGGNREEIEL
jgi:amino acid adenylation domain-containing protein